jgi:hypothetical protein
MNHHGLTGLAASMSLFLNITVKRFHSELIINDNWRSGNAGIAGYYNVRSLATGFIQYHDFFIFYFLFFIFSSDGTALQEKLNKLSMALQKLDSM